MEMIVDPNGEGRVALGLENVWPHRKKVITVIMLFHRYVFRAGSMP